MPLLDNHLEQIALSSKAIAELPFPPPKIFSNAILGSHDITALIRDTESHERALFQINPTAKPQRRATRRATAYPAEAEKESMASRIYSARNNRSQSAVARVLGSDMMERIRQSAGTSSRGQPGEINVEVLLRGAEILCNAYPVSGANEKINVLRHRHQMISNSVERLEERVADNTAELGQMSHSYGDEYDYYDTSNASGPENVNITDGDIAQELEEIREFERRKQAMEDHIVGMGRDLGGLMR